MLILLGANSVELGAAKNNMLTEIGSQLDTLPASQLDQVFTKLKFNTNDFPAGASKQDMIRAHINSNFYDTFKVE